MVIHEMVGEEADFVLVLIFQQQVIIKLFGPAVFEEPGFVMALPSDVEDSAIPDDGVAREISHKLRISKRRARLRWV